MQTPPIVLLLLAIALLCMGMTWIWKGKALNRSWGWVYRAEKPTAYWYNVLVTILAGAAILVWFISKL